MVRIFQLLDPECVELNLNSKKKRDVIKEMVDVLYRAGKIKNPEKLEEALIQREKMGTTGIGGEIAIPHVMMEDIPQTVMMFGRKKDGVRFDSIDGEPVRLLFLLVGPKGEASFHLKLLCKLSRLLHNTKFKSSLMKAKKKEEIIELFKAEEEREE